MKKVLVFGCGSIGQKHIKALSAKKSVMIGAYRTKKGFFKALPFDKANLKEFTSEKDAFNWGADYLIISNPTSLHLNCLLKGINNGIRNIFVEKPLANNYSEIKQIKKFLLRHQTNIQVGFNLRFHKVIGKVKSLISSGKFGRPLKAVLEAGGYLPGWHPYEDYKLSYAARNELGGGVLRTLSHEIDLAQFFFGAFKGIYYAKIDKISKLEINVEDDVFILFNMQKAVKVEIKLDYLRPVPERIGEILFENGLLRYNLNQNSIEFADNKHAKWKLIYSCPDYDAFSQYQDQMDAFIGRKNGLICTLEDAITVMRVIEKVENYRKGKKNYVSLR